MINVASTSIVNRPGAPASSQNRPRAVACAERSASSIPGSVAIRSTIRNAVESDATAPEQRVLLPDRAEVRDALAAVGEHHREIADHPARIMTTTPLLDRRQAASTARA